MLKNLIFFASLFWSAALYASNPNPSCDAFLGRDISIREMMVDSDESLVRLMPRTYLQHWELKMFAASPLEPKLNATGESLDGNSSPPEYVIRIDQRAVQRSAPLAAGQMSTIGLPGTARSGKSEYLERAWQAWNRRLREEPHLRKVGVFFRNLSVLPIDAPDEIEIFLDEPIRCLPRELQRRVLGRLVDDPPSPFEPVIERAFRASETTRFTLNPEEIDQARAGNCQGLDPRDPRLRELLRLIVDHYFKGAKTISGDQFLEVLDRHVVLRVEELKVDESL